jgi:hypothetical protein
MSSDRLDICRITVREHAELCWSNLTPKGAFFRWVRKIANGDYELRHVCPSVRLLAWNNSAEFAEFFSQWEMFQIKGVQKIRTHVFLFSNFFLKSCRVWDNVEKYGTARQATVDTITRRLRFARWISKATLTHTHTHTHSEYAILIALPFATVVTRTC